MRVTFHPEAHAETIEQARYYENKSDGLGTDFLDAVEETVSRLANSPKAEAISASASFPAFRLRFFTKRSRIVFTSQP